MQVCNRWMVCMALHPAWTQTRCSRYGELPAVNLVRVRSHSTKHCLFQHKHKVRLIKFWNSDRNHRSNALRENFFFPSTFARQTLTLWPNMLNFVRLTICVRDCPCFTVFRIKIEQNSCIIVKFNEILGVLTIYAN